jgi:hypothetical protein
MAAKNAPPYLFGAGLSSTSACSRRASRLRFAAALASPRPAFAGLGAADAGRYTIQQKWAMINFITNNFNNREIAIYIWLFILLIWALFKSKIRESIFGLLKALFSKKILCVILLMFSYISFLLAGVFFTPACHGSIFSIGIGPLISER